MHFAHLAPRMLPRWLAAISAWLVVTHSASVLCQEEKTDFFEKHIRPAFIAYCQECHANDTETSGGLALDSAQGWRLGGDSGPAITPGDASASLLYKAITYDSPDLQMPPDGKLPTDLIEAFRVWIDAGAVDPRVSALVAKPAKQQGLSVEQAQEHWAYRPIKRPNQESSFEGSVIDHFIERELERKGLTAAPIASDEIVLRRLYFDLTGLPPRSDQIAEYCASTQADKYERLVDQLIASPHFGETFARRWMDVVRYAESITLRGFVLPQAWRYRDYLISAFNQDRSFATMIHEHLAGDLLPKETVDVQRRQEQVVATSFLAMGNTNLEKQDKEQLEMDFIDEQLEVVGRAFLGQTIGCARCHDHKFDPIPTRDYYALAGVFRSLNAFEHDNVSKWLEEPLPLNMEDEEHYRDLTKQLSAIKQQYLELKSGISVSPSERIYQRSDLPGTVVDSSDAQYVGFWTKSTYHRPYIGDGYVHDAKQDRGNKTATFDAGSLSPGEYRVRIAYSHGPDRASNAPVTVFSADGETRIELNQRLQPDEDGLWKSLGEFRFEQDGQAFVLISNSGADGYVTIDAVQFLPKDLPQESVADSTKANEQQDALTKQVAILGKTHDELELQIKQRPRYLAVVETSPRNVAVHVRGDVHIKGDIVPRGFLTAFGSPAQIPTQSSGRLEFAQWLCDSNNPLTTRVYANRVWHWLMGTGLVRTPNNFGTTGVSPELAELLDWLAIEFADHDWSTKHLVREIVLSDAYRRSSAWDSEEARRLDPNNTLYWRANMKRIPVESLRDAMLSISGELNLQMGGSLIREGTASDYNYQHGSTRRSIYHPVFRNSLPELFEVFDFADSSVSTGQRSRSTVSTQALVLLNHPWIQQRSSAAASHFLHSNASDVPAASLITNDWNPEALERLTRNIYRDCFAREPTPIELNACTQFLLNAGADGAERQSRVESLIHSLFASLDFRYLD